MRKEVRLGLEKVTRLHGRLHNVLGSYADEIITEISKASIVTGKPYLDLLESTVKQVMSNEVSRQKGRRNLAVEKARGRIGHPWLRSRKRSLQGIEDGNGSAAVGVQGPV